MKQLSLFTVLLMAFAVSVAAQNQQIVKKVTVKSNLNLVLGEERFLFDGFKESQIFFKNSEVIEVMMNYNLLYDEMLLIVEEGDTLVLKDMSNIAAIAIGEHFYIYRSKRFHEVLELDTDSEKALLVRKYIDQGTPARYGGYGKVSPTAFIMIPNEQADGRKLSPSVEYRFQRREAYSLSQGEKIYTANKKGFLKMFAKHSKAIESYIKQESIKFNDEEDILQLYKYCIALK